MVDQILVLVFVCLVVGLLKFGLLKFGANKPFAPNFSSPLISHNDSHVNLT